MISRYRCPSCYIEFENNSNNGKCQKCNIEAFKIDERVEPAKSKSASNKSKDQVND